MNKILQFEIKDEDVKTPQTLQLNPGKKRKEKKNKNIVPSRCEFIGRDNTFNESNAIA